MATLRNCILSQERDIPLLLFLWKWKLASTATLSTKFFPGRSPVTAHKRLWNLERSGYIRSRTLSDDGKSHVWTLDRRGFHAVRDGLPSLAEEGYKSEYPSHDFLVTAFHLGDWLQDQPSHAKLISEQQLRRYESEFLPREVPSMDMHRPDGFTLLRHVTSPKVVAIEVELTPKKRSQYEMVADYYRMSEVDQVLWLVPRKTLAKRILATLAPNTGAEEQRHSFFLLSDFRQEGWQAAVHEGKDCGHSVNEILGNHFETSSQQVSTRFLLDVRKAPHRSKTYRGFEASKILD